MGECERILQILTSTLDGHFKLNDASTDTNTTTSTEIDSMRESMKTQ